MFQLFCKLKWSIEKSENIKEKKYKKLLFCLDILIECGDVAGKILNRTTEAEETFNYDQLQQPESRAPFKL